MRIALITADVPVTTAAGTSGQALLLARALASRGHRVTIYAPGDDAACPRTAIADGVPVEYICARPAGQLSADQAARHAAHFAASLAELWRSRTPEVVHAFGWASGLAALAAVRGTGVPVVQTFVSLGSAEQRHVPGHSVPETRLRLEAAIARSSSLVIASSEDEADELGRLALARSAVRIVPVGVDTELFSPDGDIVNRGRRPRLVAFAAPGQQALEVTIRALAQVPKAELVVVGGQDQRHLPHSGEPRDLAELATRLRVRPRVRFAREVQDLPALLRSADVLVSVGPYDPSGLAAVQAMACGTPAVVSAVGAQRDAVIDGTTGVLVPPLRPDILAQRLRRLLTTPALLQAYGIAGVDRVRSRHSFERIAAETQACYARCLPSLAAASADADEAYDQEEELATASG
jgi:glycosyltransferase involved in cell wall biosynthesis